MHERLINRYHFWGELVLDTGLHVGGGMATEEVRTDNPIYRDSFGRPLIPGSSMKGAFRSAVERLAQGLPGVRVCGWPAFSPFACVSEERLREKRKELEQISPAQADDELYLWLLDSTGLCDCCRLFGHVALAGRAFFADVALKDGQVEPGLELRDGVAIDRDSGRAVPRLKYDFEVVPSGTRFDFQLIVENAMDKDLGLIAIGVWELKDGMIPLGGIKSRGLGHCHVEGIKISYVDFANKADLLAYATQRKMKEIEDPDAKLTVWVEALI